MKNQLLNLKMIALVCLMMVLGGANVWAQETKSVTCTLGAKATACTSTGDCSVSWKYSSDPTTNNQPDNGMYWAIKNSETVTLTAKLNVADATITSVIIKAYTNSGNGKTIDVTVGGNKFGKTITLTNTSTDYNLTGSATGDLVLSMKSTTGKKSHIIKTVTINYTESSSSNKTATTLTFPQESCSFATTDDLASFKGQTATLKAGEIELTDKAITYSKAGDDIFSSFDETTGALALNGKAGSATITAKFDGSNDETYSSSNAKYTITVEQVYADLASFKAAIPSTATTYNPDQFKLKLTDALVTYVNGSKAYVQDATAGVLLYDNNSKKAFNLTAGQKFTGSIDVSACIYNGMAEVTAWSPAADVVKIDNVEIPVKTVTLADLNGADYSKYECVRVKVVNATVTEGFDTAKKANIKQNDQTYIVHGEVTGLKVTINDVYDFVGYPIYWKTKKLNEYQLSVWSQDDIKESGKTSETLDFKATDGTSYYATFSSDKDVVFTNDVTVYGVSVDGGKISTNAFTPDLYEVTDATAGIEGMLENAYYVPANTGVLLECKNVTATYYFFKDGKVTLPANLLKPAPANGGVFEATDGYKYYKLAYDDFGKQTGLGFYWGAPEGGKFFVKAGTAYLAVPEATAAGAKGFTLNGEATGIEGVNANVENAKAIYNLNGQRVASMAKPGLYIVNGKKVVRK